MDTKEITILVGKHKGNDLIPKDTLYYRFFVNIDGNFLPYTTKRKKKQPTKEIYEEILKSFLMNEQLISIKYDTFCISKRGEECLGLELQNTKEEKLNVYFTSNALSAFAEFENFIENRKTQDFYEYAKHPIEKNMVERLTFRPTLEERSSILYILNNLRYDYFQIRKQLGYYYRKNNRNIDESDLNIIYSIIRYFINFHLERHPYYEYKKSLKTNTYNLIIHCGEKSFIEIIDPDLIQKVESARIIDDLWLVKHGIIDRMPSQEESMRDKEELKRKKALYKKQNFS